MIIRIALTAIRHLHIKQGETREFEIELPTNVDPERPGRIDLAPVKDEPHGRCLTCGDTY